MSTPEQHTPGEPAQVWIPGPEFEKLEREAARYRHLLGMALVWNGRAERRAAVADAEHRLEAECDKQFRSVCRWFRDCDEHDIPPQSGEEWPSPESSRPLTNADPIRTHAGDVTPLGPESSETGY